MIKKVCSSGKILLDLKDTEIYYLSNFLSEKEAWEFFFLLQKKIPWKQEKIRIFGKWIEEPRLTCWMGDKDANYKYSGKLRKPVEWIKEVSDIKKELEKFTKVKFNSVLINLYRNGKDSNSWHKDNERELGKNPTIASISLGEKRMIEFRSNDKKEKLKVCLEHGSLLFMGRNSQIHYFHQVPKMKFVDQPRINLTFRYVNQIREIE